MSSSNYKYWHFSYNIFGLGLIIALLVFLCVFLYANFYKTMIVSQELSSLRRDVVMEDLNKDGLIKAIDVMDKKTKLPSKDFSIIFY